MYDHGKNSSLTMLATLSDWLSSTLLGLASFSYLLGSVILVAFQPSWKAMAPLTAVSIGALAIPLIYARATRRAVFLSLAFSVSLFALAVLASQWIARADLINPILMRLVGIDPALGGRTSVATAMCLLLLAVASVARLWRALGVLEWLANTALLISGTALLGYAYDISNLYSYFVFNTMALSTALALFCLSIALLLCEPDSRLGMAVRSAHAGGRRLRHMLSMTVVPPILGWVLLHSKSLTTGGSSFAIALLVMCTTIPMFYLLLEYARATELLNRTREAQAILLQDEVTRITTELAITHQREVSAMAQVERSKRWEVIAQLTGSITHDFNNLLMVIGGSAQLMKMQIPASSALLRHVEKISVTVKATAKLTAQLAAFSRTQRLEMQPVLIDEVVQAAVNDTLDVFQSDIRLVQKFEARNAWVLADRVQLHLAVVHLLRNASDALGDYGTLTVSTNVARSGSPDGDDTITIRVEDDGCGMSAEVMSNATEPFFTTKSGSQHQGLGLAQASSVVHQASGTLSLSAAPGRGTRVDISLPRHAPLAKPAYLGIVAGLTTQSDNRRLLVIDDDPDVRNVIVELLRSMHYDVSEAHDGESGLSKLEQVQPALVIIDYLMPGMNGGEVARRARMLFPALPVLFISGYADSEAIAAVPYARLLRKPILPQELGQAISIALTTTSL